MQQLHLVGFTTDLEGLIFSARKGAKSGGYLVLLDEKLRATVEDALRLRNGQAPDDDEGGSGPPRRPRPESTLSPREIQSRLRSGSTIAEVAREAGVDEEWVSRFAVPIQAEQAQVVGRARRLAFVKPRLGESALPLGTAVRWNLADKGVLLFDDEYEAAWSAYNLQGASWVVRFEYASRQKRQRAEWEVDLREGELFARNRTASELGYVDAARRRRRPPALEPSPRETPGRPVDQSRPAPPRREEETPVAPRPAAARRGPDADGRGRGASTRGRGAAKKASAAPAKARKAGAAKKAGKSGGKATASRKAASTKRGRPQKPAGKKRGSTDQVAPKVAVTPAAAPADEPVRPSHLARPPSPIPSARRATTLPLHTPRYVPPRPVAPPVRRPPPPEPEPEPEVAVEPEPERAAPRRPAPSKPTPRAVGEGVRVLGRPEKANGQGSATSEPRRRPRAEQESATVSPERKLARRLASTPPSAAAGGRTRRSAPPATDAESEVLWHGPGSGEPAPTVRIRADLAAGTRRPVEAPGVEAPAARTRRQRPLRAR